MLGKSSSGPSGQGVSTIDRSAFARSVAFSITNDGCRPADGRRFPDMTIKEVAVLLGRHDDVVGLPNRLHPTRSQYDDLPAMDADKAKRKSR
jgi:hypothetical protein